MVAAAKELVERGAARTVALFGGAARGRFVPGRSDVNLLVVLARRDATGGGALDRSTLACLHEVLERCRRGVDALPETERAAIEPMFVGAEEFDRVALLFPVKCRDIVARHEVLAGDEGFLRGRSVPMTHARLRVEQELRNLALRTRRRLVAVVGERPSAAALLGTIARPLAIELAELLRLDGVTPPAEDRTSAILAMAAERYGLDGPALARVAAIRQGEPIDGDDDLGDLLLRIQASIDRAAQAAAGGEG